MITERNVTAGDNSIQFVVVTTAIQFQHAMCIRAICYMEEENVVAAQAIDGNDFQATHILIYKNDEPIGGIRIRWFKEFAKLERTAIRKAYRNPRLLSRFAEFVFNHIAKKGYSLALTHAKPEYARLWQILLKFELVDAKTPLHFRGHSAPYVELVKRITARSDAIGLQSDIATLFRIEGAWDEVSEFEQADHPSK